MDANDHPFLVIDIQGECLLCYERQTDEEIEAKAISFVKEALAQARKLAAERAEMMKNHTPTPIQDVFAGLP